MSKSTLVKMPHCWKSHVTAHLFIYRLCEIKTGDVVCDPMCGSGSIPVEVETICFLSIMFLSLYVHCKNMAYGNVISFLTLFSFFSQKNVCYQGWNSQFDCQNSKQGRP